MKRSIIGVALALSVFLAPLAHADSVPVPIGDPYTDTIQLWSEIASAISSLANDFATLFNGHEVATTNAPSNSQQGSASLAATVESFNSTPHTVTSATSSEYTPDATSDQTTLSQNVKSAQSTAPANSTIIADAALSFDASDFVTQSEFIEALRALSNSLSAKSAPTTTPILPEWVAADGNPTVPYAAENNITNLSGVTISTPSISGGSISNASLSNVTGLSTSDLSDFSYATSTDFISGIVAWGDSLTQGSGYTYPDELSVLAGVPVVNEGIAGQTTSQIEARMVAATQYYSWPTIIWTGRNDISGNLSTDEPNVLNGIASMVAVLQSVGNNDYIILSIPNAETEPSGSTNYDEIIAINGALASTYGSHYLDEREYLVQHGLSLASITPSTQDETDISNDIPPTDLRADSEHPNATGDWVIAQYIYQDIGLLIPATTSTPILTTKNIFSILQSPPTFPFLDTQEGYGQDGSTILFASSANQNTLIGDYAGQNLPTTTVSVTASYNTAVGYEALATATSSSANVAVGRLALEDETSGSGNTAVGHAAENFLTTGSNNNAFGNNAMGDGVTTGSGNNAFGSIALYKDTTGGANAAFGGDALLDNTTGSQNAALSGYALEDNTTGSQNVAIGYTAEQDNVSATNTVAIGYEAAFGNPSAYNDQGTVAVGALAGFKLQTDSDYNTLLGYQAGESITTGTDNISIGVSRTGGTFVQTGSNNILIGYNANTPTTTQSDFLNIGGVLFGTLPATTSATTFSVQSGGMIGIGTSTPYAPLSVWGSNTASSTLAFNVVNSASTTVFSVFDGGNAELSGSLSQSSDQRLKTNIQSLEASSSLSFIDELNPVTFNWIDPNQTTALQLGFIAQQVQQIFPNLVSTTSATALTPGGTLSLNYIGLISPIVSAIQELSSEIASLAQSITTQVITAVTGNFSVGNFTSELCVGSTCVTPAQFQAMVAAASASQSSGQGSGGTPADDAEATDTPPVIQINGDKPAIVQIGDTYNDLGATITGPRQDLNLGIQTFVDGVQMSTVQIDTSQAATDTVQYVATDQNGLTSTSTRTVIIEGPSIVPTDSATSTPALSDDPATTTSAMNTATTTDATTTAQ